MGWTIPAEAVCVNCGKIFKPNSPRNNTCSLECRQQRDRRTDLMYHKRKRAEKKAEKISRQSISQIVTEANKKGITYGQYVVEIERKLPK